MESEIRGLGLAGVFPAGVVPEAFVGGDVEGAGVVAQVLQPVRAGPQVAAAFEGEIGPGGVGLGPVVLATQGGDVAGTGVPAGPVGLDVVAVGVVLVGPQPAGGSGAPGEDTGAASSR